MALQGVSNFCFKVNVILTKIILPGGVGIAWIMLSFPCLWCGQTSCVYWKKLLYIVQVQPAKKIILKRGRKRQSMHHWLGPIHLNESQSLGGHRPWRPWPPPQGWWLTESNNKPCPFLFNYFLPRLLCTTIKWIYSKLDTVQIEEV